MAMENKRIIQLSTERTNLTSGDYVMVDSDADGSAKYRLDRLKETDTTLSVSGKAADAAATGQAISDEAEARENADTALGNDIGDLKSALDTVSDSVFVERYNPPVLEVEQGWRLNDTDGLSHQDANYKLVKYGVAKGSIVIVQEDDRFQFQNDASVPSSGNNNRVGETYSSGKYIVTVPEGATHIILSSTSNGSAVVEFVDNTTKRLFNYLTSDTYGTKDYAISATPWLGYYLLSNNAPVLHDGTTKGLSSGWNIFVVKVQRGKTITISNSNNVYGAHSVWLNSADPSDINSDAWESGRNNGSHVCVTDYLAICEHKGITSFDKISVTYAYQNDILLELDKKADIANTPAKEHYNLFNTATVTLDHYVDSNTGELKSNSLFDASDFIYIGDLASYNASGTHIIAYYDSDKAYAGKPDSVDTIDSDATYTVPSGVSYLRFSTYKEYVATAQIGKDISRSIYMPYDLYGLPNLLINPSQVSKAGGEIIVDVNGNGDYTSFTEAVYRNLESREDIHVRPGTYDIVAEYVALFGQSAVDNMADSDSSIFGGFQYGIPLRNRTVEFDAGSKLVCDWTGHVVDDTHRFCAIRLDYNVKVIGMYLVGTALWYVVHDDYGLYYEPYTVEYDNCRVIGYNVVNANCIGAGCKKYSRHVIRNSYFDNNSNEPCVRYHNTYLDGAEPEIFVSNCYFNSYFAARWYGEQTTKMKVYVSNCHAKAIYKDQESSSYNVDNIELYKWNNEETNPRT